ncbi:hypothetical protein ACI43T_12260, partial [Neisseria oralis]
LDQAEKYQISDDDLGLWLRKWKDSIMPATIRKPLAVTLRSWLESEVKNNWAKCPSQSKARSGTSRSERVKAALGLP